MLRVFVFFLEKIIKKVSAYKLLLSYNIDSQ